MTASPYLDHYSAIVGALNDEAKVFYMSEVVSGSWARYGLLSAVGDEGGPNQIGQIRDFGDGLAILSHRYRNGTWTRVYRRNIPSNTGEL